MNSSPTIFFDDSCVLCNKSVQFIIKHDKKELFYFASMNSEVYKDLGAIFPDWKMPTESVLLFSKGKLYSRSSAALRIACKLCFPIPLLCIGFLIPPFIRNNIYDWIARNRYRWFGKMDGCFVPDGKMKDRFLG